MAQLFCADVNADAEQKISRIDSDDKQRLPPSLLLKGEKGLLFDNRYLPN
jgi:hypothetical protein